MSSTSVFKRIAEKLANKEALTSTERLLYMTRDKPESQKKMLDILERYAPKEAEDTAQSLLNQSSSNNATVTTLKKMPPPPAPIKSAEEVKQLTAPGPIENPLVPVGSKDMVPTKKPALQEAIEKEPSVSPSKDLVPMKKVESVPESMPPIPEEVPVPAKELTTVEPSRTSPLDGNIDVPPEELPSLASPSAAVAAGAAGAVATGKEDKKARDLADETGVPYDIVVQWLATQETK